jgi:hypothetical protein
MGIPTDIVLNAIFFMQIAKTKRCKQENGIKTKTISPTFSNI